MDTTNVAPVVEERSLLTFRNHCDSKLLCHVTDNSYSILGIGRMLQGKKRQYFLSEAIMCWNLHLPFSDTEYEHMELPLNTDITLKVLRSRFPELFVHKYLLCSKLAERAQQVRHILPDHTMAL
jgi:hypothetical protein